jgi:hypothetical protein
LAPAWRNATAAKACEATGNGLAAYAIFTVFFIADFVTGRE